MSSNSDIQESIESLIISQQTINPSKFNFLSNVNVRILDKNITKYMLGKKLTMLIYVDKLIDSLKDNKKTLYVFMYNILVLSDNNYILYVCFHQFLLILTYHNSDDKENLMLLKN